MAVTEFEIIAHDVDSGSPNEMHKGELPRSMGFKGGFVLGTGNFGQMTRGLLRACGSRWLERNVVEMKFLRPTFEGDRLRVTMEPLADCPHPDGYLLRAYTADGLEAVHLETWVPSPFPDPDPRAGMTPMKRTGPPRPWLWEDIEVNVPFRPCTITPTREENEKWCAELGADDAIYREGPNPPLHPTVVMRCFARANHREFRSDAVVAIGNRITTHRPIRVGVPVDIVTVPIEKFQRNGNIWVVLYSAAKTDGGVAVETLQTKIVRIRPPAERSIASNG